MDSKRGHVGSEGFECRQQRRREHGRSLVGVSSVDRAGSTKQSIVRTCGAAQKYPATAAPLHLSAEQQQLLPAAGGSFHGWRGLVDTVCGDVISGGESK